MCLMRDRLAINRATVGRYHRLNIMIPAIDSSSPIMSFTEERPAGRLPTELTKVQQRLYA